jgi:hypothetical protein
VITGGVLSATPTAWGIMSIMMLASMMLLRSSVLRLPEGMLRPVLFYRDRAAA